ncbi:MAG TPA: ABC transporter permease [Bryobacteraceae bacterium]
MIHFVRESLARVLSFFRRKQRDGELEMELAADLELAVEENVRRGMSPEEARRNALIRLGGLTEAREAHRDARGLPAAESILQDLRYTFRTLRRDAGFTTFAILIIGLGIGASSTVFSVVQSLLIRPLPFRDPASLVWIANSGGEGDMSGQTVQVTRLTALRDRNASFSDIAGYFAFYGVGDSTLTGRGEPERLSGVPVSQNFFPLLGVQPQLGRQFTPEECKWNGPKAVMLSYGLWKRRFASDPDIVGRPLTLDNAPFIVAGVMPAWFDFGSIFAPGAHIDLYFPFPLSKETDQWGNTLAIVGRLKPGVGLGQAQAEASVLGQYITAEHPHQNGLDPKLTLLRDHVSGRLRPALFVLACAVGVVMLIVCANLSSLLLARTATRQKEMAIRSALGAGRKRLIRQLLTESVVLTCCGAALGLVLAVAGTRGLAHLNAFNIPLLDSVHLDARALGFTLLVAVATGLVLGLAPAIQVSTISLNAALAAGQRGASESKRHTWIRSALVVSEIAFACVLLVGAGLLIRSFVRVLDVSLGFQPERAAALRIDPSSQYKTQAQRNAYFDEALRRVKAVPGIEAAGLTDVLPLGHNRAWGAGAKGQSYKDGDYPSAFVRIVSDGYLKAMGMSLRKGRDFTPRDTPSSKHVMLINETLARRLWPGQDPIGKIIPDECNPGDREVVGVVGDVHHIALEQSSGSEMYMPIRQCQDYGTVDLVVRSRQPLSSFASSVEATLRPIEPNLPKGGFRPLEDLVDRAVSPRRFILLLLGGFAGFALALASLGIYALISYSVGQRTQEIGIRMALGASTSDVQGRIVLQTLVLAAVGMSLGLAAASALSRSLGGLLFGVTSNDPLSFLATFAVLTAVALLAGYLPARRASRIDPAIALRVS